MKLPKEHFSFSQANMYQRCPKQYEFRYIEDIVRPPSVSLIWGSSEHIALELNNNHKVETKEDLPADDVVECFCDTFDSKAKEISEWEGQTKDSVIEKGTALTKEYMEIVAPEIQPEVVEQEFRITIPVDDDEVEVLGYIDLEQPDITSDYKVVGKTKTQADTDSDLQLPLYDMVTNKGKAEFICLVKTKKPKIVRVATEITQQRKDWAVYTLGEIAKAVSAGVFPPCNPAEWCCSEKWCGYWYMCRGKGSF